jgi:hypothetical protein
MRSPGRTSTVWPIVSEAAGTSRAMPFSSTNAVFFPSTKGAGDGVFAGSINREAALRVRVAKAAEDNTIAR